MKIKPRFLRTLTAQCAILVVASTDDKIDYVLYQIRQRCSGFILSTSFTETFNTFAQGILSCLFMLKSCPFNVTI